MRAAVEQVQLSVSDERREGERTFSSAARRLSSCVLALESTKVRSQISQLSVEMDTACQSGKMDSRSAVACLSVSR